MSAIIINKDNFEAEVLKSEKRVLLDFYADWCAPCKMMLPIVEQIAEEHPEYRICKINVDEQPELAARFGVMSIPALVVMENGEIVSQTTGAKPKAVILKMLG